MVSSKYVAWILDILEEVRDIRGSVKLAVYSELDLCEWWFDSVEDPRLESPLDSNIQVKLYV